MAKLTEVADIQYGYAFDSKNFTDDASYPQLVRIRDIKRGFSETFYKGEYSKDYVLYAGDLLVGMDGEFNVARWKVDGALLNQRVCKIMARPNTDEEYLRFILRKILKKIEVMTSFVTVKHLSAKELNNTELDIPKYEEQVHRAKILLKLEAIIDKRQSQLDKLDELVRARFVEMFGDPIINEKNWDAVKLNVTCNRIGDGLHGTPKYDEDGVYPFINGNNLKDGVIEVTSITKMVNKETYKKHFITMNSNTILLSINGTLGKLALYNGEEVMLGKSVCYCNLKHEINRKFVYGVMNIDSFKSFLESNATSSTIKNVGLKAIRGFKLILPPKELQNKYVDFVEQVNKSKLLVASQPQIHIYKTLTLL